MNAALNPWNVKTPAGGPWLGQTGTDAGGTALFDTPEHGARACARNLESYYRAGHRTLRQIVTRATPPDDTQGSRPGNPLNDTVGYMTTLAGRLGLGLDDAIPEPRAWPAFVCAFLYQVARLEMPNPAFDWESIERGVRVWLKDFV